MGRFLVEYLFCSPRVDSTQFGPVCPGDFVFLGREREDLIRRLIWTFNSSFQFQDYLDRPKMMKMVQLSFFSVYSTTKKPKRNMRQTPEPFVRCSAHLSPKVFAEHTRRIQFFTIAVAYCTPKYYHLCCWPFAIFRYSVRCSFIL